MDSDTIKAAIFLIAAVGAAFAARTFFGGEAKPDPFASPPPPEPTLAPESQVPKVGNELPFPREAVQAVSEVDLAYRPRILNYYFRKTDLVAGPADPTEFIDDFFVEWENPADGNQWTQEITVATPAGLSREMREQHSDFLFTDNFLVVDRFNLGKILAALVAQYAADRLAERNAAAETAGVEDDDEA